jgi:hypothetical protein
MSFVDNFVTVSTLEQYENAIENKEEHVYLIGDWVSDYSFDFQGREKHVRSFKCPRFNQPIESFGMLKYFDCDDFNQPVTSFDQLEFFSSSSFKQPVQSFASLTHFSGRYY